MIIKKDKSFIQAYLEDSSNLKGGHLDEVFIPKDIDEVSSIIREANLKGAPITISGAGTGQAGGRIPFGGAVLSCEKLTMIKEINNTDKGGMINVEAGVLIDDLKTASKEKKLFYTYDPTEQTAFVGGTIATNASGARSFKYGSTRKFVQSLKVVLADGSIFSIRRGDIKANGLNMEFSSGSKTYKFKLPSYQMPNTKNSAGYYSKKDMDLIDLFIGQEGTLGVIVEAELFLLKAPKGFFSFFVFLKDKEKAWSFVDKASLLNPSAIEYFDHNSIELLQNKYGNVPSGSEAALLIEDEINMNEEEIEEKWEKALFENGISLDNTWAAMSEKSHLEFLEKRRYIPEKMSEMAKSGGFTKVSTDLAVPKDKSLVMINFYEEKLKNSQLEHYIFGHIGDAHLHVNMLPKDEIEYKKAKELQLDFIKKSISLGGTVSAEHGIGKTKKEFLKLLYGEKGIEEMIAVKKALDPKLILGRGNIFDAF